MAALAIFYKYVHDLLIGLVDNPCLSGQSPQAACHPGSNIFCALFLGLARKLLFERKAMRQLGAKEDSTLQPRSQFKRECSAFLTSCTVKCPSGVRPFENRVFEHKFTAASSVGRLAMARVAILAF